MEKKKTSSKKVVNKKAKTGVKKEKQVKQELNETVNLTKHDVNNAKKEVIHETDHAIIDSLNKQECIHCHKFFDKGLTICPYCRRSQKDKTGPIVIVILAIILLLSIIISYFVSKYNDVSVSAVDYEKSCKLVAYEDLVRKPKKYKNEAVKIIGVVESVTGTDTDYGNKMVITINANMFDETTEQRVIVNFDDKDYSQGFIKGDTISIYGTFSKINGNTPVIDAKYIVFGM
jgi:hypothetical protein